MSRGRVRRPWGRGGWGRCRGRGWRRWWWQWWRGESVAWPESLRRWTRSPVINSEPPGTSNIVSLCRTERWTETWTVRKMILKRMKKTMVSNPVLLHHQLINLLECLSVTVSLSLVSSSSLQMKTRLRTKERRGRGTLKMRMMTMMIDNPQRICKPLTPSPSPLGRPLGCVPILILVSSWWAPSASHRHVQFINPLNDSNVW